MTADASVRRHPPEPSPEDCSERRLVWENQPAVALWYPQMGGYVGKAVVTVADDAGGVDVFVWHDGTFPFTADQDDLDGVTRTPVRLHHCDVGQFRLFADQVEAWQESL